MGEEAQGAGGPKLRHSLLQPKEGCKMEVHHSQGQRKDPAALITGAAAGLTTLLQPAD